MIHDETPHASEARDRVLEAAERLFAEKGYAALTLRDIAAEVGIRHASLYHHVPGGKPELFVEVTERNLNRHRAGLEAAIAGAGPELRRQLYAAADWLLSQPPMDLLRMVRTDMVEIDPKHVARLSRLAYESLLGPVQAALRSAYEAGAIKNADAGLVAGGLVGMIESLYSVPEFTLTREGRTRQNMAHDLIDVMLDGLL
jgi:AcrR family transcriptional regulator